ncbi:SOS response-associated peptidase [Sunxiuqinia sp. A32]|uniref:SOS response-associated peptidase n=1 Tax=Sunxiuqinia sp. A32 TaxID=3461496 RepID=UPI0040460857
MCYSFRSILYAQKKRYEYWRKVWEKEADVIDDRGQDLFFADGFNHPTVLIYTDSNPFIPVSSTWGLIPSWSKDLSIWNKTLNARGETIFDKPAFRESAKSKRCLVYINGFFEYHHFKGKTYPYYIFNKDETPMILAGLWNDWTDRSTGEILNTFSIVTTSANPMMACIHNNPKLNEPRMPVILPEDYADEWLKPIKSDSDKQVVSDLIKPFSQEKMDSYTVGTLRGKNAIGNVPESSSKVFYPELNDPQDQLSIF